MNWQRSPRLLPATMVNHPEYATSAISKFEVDQRDKIAKINAEYNAISSSTSSSYYSNNNAAVAIESTVHQMSTSPPNQPLADTFKRAASSQPAHSNLHFATKPNDFKINFNLKSTPSIFRTLNPGVYIDSPCRNHVTYRE